VDGERIERREEMKILLSILTPAVPSRLEQLGRLCDELERQIGGLPVEHLVFLDNKRRTVGEKRDALLRAAHGKYVAYVDDDDWISSDYVRELVNAAAAEPGPDVITFMQHSTVNGQEATIEFGLGNPNEGFRGRTDLSASLPLIKRDAWHVCAWRRKLAMLSSFPAINYGEDWAYASRLCALPGLKSVHIPLTLHFYRHDAAKTEAPQTSFGIIK
jgi:glycosyltransferase involved in cell wall biosynthesis